MPSEYEQLLQRRDELDGQTLVFANRTADDVICERELRYLLGDRIESYQIVAFAIVAASMISFGACAPVPKPRPAGTSGRPRCSVNW